MVGALDPAHIRWVENREDPMRMQWIAVSVVALGLAVAGCSGGGDGDDTANTAGGAEAKKTTATEAAEIEKRIEAGEYGTWTLALDEVEVAEVVGVADLDGNPKPYAGKIVKVEGTVSKVCKSSGCWVEVVAPDGATITASSPDHDLLLPKNCEGANITVEGIMLEEAPEGGEPTYTFAMKRVTIDRPEG
jgi:hypothetical protein